MSEVLAAIRIRPALLPGLETEVDAGINRRLDALELSRWGSRDATFLSEADDVVHGMRGLLAKQAQKAAGLCPDADFIDSVELPPLLRHFSDDFLEILGGLVAGLGGDENRRGNLDHLVFIEHIDVSLGGRHWNGIELHRSASSRNPELSIILRSMDGTPARVKTRAELDPDGWRRRYGGSRLAGLARIDSEDILGLERLNG